MSEAPAQPTPAPEVTPEPAPTPTPAPPAQETDWKAEARKWEERAKGNKSALDELTGKYTVAESERTDLAAKLHAFESEKERASLVSAVAKDKNVPADALRGTTREELEAHADQLAALLKPSGPVIPGQEQAPGTVPTSPESKFVGDLFKS
jgi:hypothetical protein